MKIVVAGSLGHISRPLTERLMEERHSVTVVTSRPERRTEIEALGASAAVGTMEDADFLTETFAGADAVYAMIAIGQMSYFDKDLDIEAATVNIGRAYRRAIENAGVSRVVFLSSIGAHTDRGNGLLSCYFELEKIIGTLPPDVSITFMRPVGFYYNLFSFIPAIKTQGVIASNYGGDVRKPWVSPIDIAAAAAEELTTRQPGRGVRYVASEEITCSEIASVLGAAIGKPDLKWVVIPDEQMLSRMVASGMNPRIAAGLVEMNASLHTGILYEDYYQHRPVVGGVKIKDFAKEFAAAYNQT